MIYPTRGNPWGEKELRDIVEKLMLREASEPFLGHAADAIEFLLDAEARYIEYEELEEKLTEINEELAYAREKTEELIQAVGVLEKCLNT